MALFSAAGVLGSVAIGFTAWSCVTLLSNYVIARKIGLPIVLSPISKMNVPWVVACTYTRIQHHLQRLPFGLGKWARYSYLGWVFDEKYTLYQELGPAFVVVNPTENDLCVAGAEATHDIQKRWKDFIKPRYYEVVDRFGPNLTTAEGDDWSRHRKLTAPTFNEKSSALSWMESLAQAQAMSRIWLQKGSEGNRETAKDTATLAMNVLTAVAYGLPYPFHEESPKLTPGHTMTYKDAMATILGLYTMYLIIPISTMSSPWMPRFIQKLGLATKEFTTYNEEMFRNTRSSILKGEPVVANLLSALVRASDNAHKTTISGRSQGLSEDEIYGNLFIYGLGGHETTANILTYTMCMMAAYPEWQEWVAEEIYHVTKDYPGPQAWKYEEIHPQLKRCLAVMFETLRLYGSVIIQPRHTSTTPQPLTIAGKTYLIPANTAISLNIHANHVSPEYFAPDPLAWRPARWITAGAGGRTGIGREELVELAPGTFTPWTGGPRICPGKKFAQVEFTAVMAVVFRQMRVEPVVASGQKIEEVRKQVVAMAEDSQLQPTTLQMREGGRIALAWRQV
ncbi:MAG: hypothetical protein MMC33_005068 [Icmadophila ericetorum]|nr:hypothetical protein [Icmadophila ericetorum]